MNASTPPAPPRIGRFRIDGVLGEGGMGVVYRGFDEKLERAVAVKTIAARVAKDESARKRFLREARAAAKVQHPNVCQLYEVGEDEGALYIAMELLQGEPLSDRLRRGPLPMREAVDVAVSILDALEGLHRENIVHRDLKPSNIFLTPNGVKLLDFGLARTMAATDVDSSGATESQVTQDGTLLGTPRYMAPEQYQGRPADHRTDLFALGAVLFEMVTGNQAFAGTTPVEVYHKTLYEQPPAIGGSESAAAVDRIVRRALAKQPGSRYESAEAMKQVLRSVPVSRDAATPDVHTVTRLVVLPFRLLRPDPEMDFLAVSLPDAITHALSGLESLAVRSSVVASRFSEEQDLERVAQDADVDVALTGSLLIGGDRIQVQIQLLQVPAGTVIWSQRSQIASRDAFELQDEIVEKILDSLSVSLTAREKRLLEKDVPASPTAYEFFLRANRLLFPQGIASADNLAIARDLYTRAVEEDPLYAPAWVRLGRCHWLIGKGGDDRDEHVAQAEACFEKALELNPDLPLAHNVYALLDIDRGRALDAMVRLLERAQAGSSEPELFAALVQSSRFCGLLEASVAAHERAVARDRNVVTSVYQTMFHLGDYERSLELAKKPYYLDAAMLALQGKPEEAIRRLETREAQNLSPFIRAIVGGLRATLEGKKEEALKAAEAVFTRFPDPEAVFGIARHVAFLGEHKRAVRELERVLDGGFILYRSVTRDDPWLDGLRGRPDFVALVERASARYREACIAYREAGGPEVLGVSY